MQICNQWILCVLQSTVQLKYKTNGVDWGLLTNYFFLHTSKSSKRKMWICISFLASTCQPFSLLVRKLGSWRDSYKNQISLCSIWWKFLLVSINFGMKLKQNLSVMNEIEIQSNPNGTRSRLSLLDQSLLSNSSVDLHRSYLVRSI